MTRAVVRGDHPGSEAGWRQSVEQRLGDLFTRTATALRRVISDGDVDITNDGNLNVRGGQLRIFDDDTEDADPIWTNLDGPTRHDVGQKDIDGVSFSNGDDYATAATLTYIVPKGYTRCHVTAFAAAGTTLGTSGNITVLPYIGDRRGPSINSGSYGAGSAAVATSYFGANLNVTPGYPLDVIAYVYLYGSPAAQSNNNVHLTVTITWLR